MRNYLWFLVCYLNENGDLQFKQKTNFFLAVVKSVVKLNESGISQRFHDLDLAFHIDPVGLFGRLDEFRRKTKTSFLLSALEHSSEFTSIIYSSATARQRFKKQTNRCSRIKVDQCLPANFFFHFIEIPNIQPSSYLDISRFKRWLDLCFYRICLKSYLNLYNRYVLILSIMKEDSSLTSDWFTFVYHNHFIVRWKIIYLDTCRLDGLSPRKNVK